MAIAPDAPSTTNVESTFPASPGCSQPKYDISASSAYTPKMQLIASKATEATQARNACGRFPRGP